MGRSNKLVSKKEARKIVCISRTQMWRLERANSFPRARLIPGSSKSVYVYSELIDWLEQLPSVERTGEDAEKATSPSPDVNQRREREEHLP